MSRDRAAGRDERRWRNPWALEVEVSRSQPARTSVLTRRESRLIAFASRAQREQIFRRSRHLFSSNLCRTSVFHGEACHCSAAPLGKSFTVASTSSNSFWSFG